MAISTYGHYAQHPRDLIQWAFFADPSKYGLNQMSDFPLSYDLQSTEGVRLLAGRTLLTDIARWNDLFLRALDGSFFGTLFSSPTEVIGFTTSTPIQQAISKSRRGITSEEPSVSTVNYSADAANSGGKVNLPKCDSAISFTRWTNCVGSITFNNGINWTGGWTDGKQDGFGKFTFVDGSTYIGELKNGKQNGQGNTNYASGNKYVGEYRDNKLHGQGVFTYADGRTPREGIWEDNKFIRAQRIADHIAGRTSTPSVALAPSQVSTAEAPLAPINLPACRGVDFSRWTGCFGTQTRSSGAIYVGEFKNGKPDGQGSLTYPRALRSGAPPSKYVGEFKDGDFNGQGIHTYEIGFGRTDSIGRTEEGLWQNGQFVQSQRIPDHIAGRTSTVPVAQASRPVEAPRSVTLLSLSASASQPSPDGVVTLSITTNNATASLKINGDEEGGRVDGRYSVRKFAQVGENKFEVVAVDRSGNTQRQTVTVSRAIGEVVARIQPLNPIGISESKPRDAVAIIIGIEKYRRVPTADFANKDASVFYDYARRALGVKQENIKLLLDDKADAAEILVAFKNWLPTRVSKGKTDVYVFYSGHGLPSEDGNSLYFLPHEANRDLLDRTAIAQKELVDAIQRSSPKTVTMFIDSCYSGQSRTGETLLASARPIAVTAKQTSSFPSNFTVISASAPDQISSSSPELKHGIFSYYLMRGMEGEADTNKDKQITVAEMQAYLSENVSRRAMGMNRTQQPQIIGDQTRVLVGQ